MTNDNKFNSQNILNGQQRQSQLKQQKAKKLEWEGDDNDWDDSVNDPGDKDNTDDDWDKDNINNAGDNDNIDDDWDKDIINNSGDNDNIDDDWDKDNINSGDNDNIDDDWDKDNINDSGDNDKDYNGEDDDDDDDVGDDDKMATVTMKTQRSPVEWVKTLLSGPPRARPKRPVWTWSRIAVVGEAPRNRRTEDLRTKLLCTETELRRTWEGR